MKHTQEPWKVEIQKEFRPGFSFATITPEYKAAPTLARINACTMTGEEQTIADALRIIECVNACAGIANPRAIARLIETASRICTQLQCANGSNADEAFVNMRAALEALANSNQTR